MQRRFAGAPGILIEDKGCSVAVAPRPEGAELGRDDETVAATLGAGYRLQLGKAVARCCRRAPARAASSGILTQGAYRDRRPIFIGDDLTDEQAFARR